MAVTRKKKTVWLVFNYYRCISEIKLKIEWQIAVMSTKKDDIIDQIALLAALRWVKNFKPYNKSFYILAKRVFFMTKNILMVILVLRLDDIWKNRNMIHLEQPVLASQAWFMERLYNVIKKN